MSDATAAVIIALLLINLVGLLIVGLRVSGQSRDSLVFERRLSKLEAEVKALPTYHDLNELRADIGEVVRSVASIDGQMETVATMLRTVQTHLLERDR